MKQKFNICNFAKHVLATGILFPAAVCITYAVGLICGRIYSFCAYDVGALLVLTAETFAACLVVAIACAFFAEWLYRRGRS